MNSKLRDINKLMQLKLVRCRRAEAQANLARSEESRAEAALKAAAALYNAVIDNAARTRMVRLEEVFAARDLHPLHQAKAVAVYEMTQIEIGEARGAWRLSRENVVSTKECSAMAQSLLARRLRELDKIKNLRSGIERRMRETASRRA